MSRMAFIQLTNVIFQIFFFAGMFVNEGINQVLKRVIAEPRPSRSKCNIVIVHAVFPNVIARSEVKYNFIYVTVGRFYVMISHCATDCLFYTLTALLIYYSAVANVIS